ncbi:DUF2339 domain-containing protein [Alkalicoccus halolimnae]|uniref:DUF2339 domain-containing protein n=1 Tax=Alkalicoccus halolimnae TaxID=1667239 RepID=A0A5C7F7B4_9BACI|nr:DUF2339 domain-containing protein [Alkalicoccus halolimnae]TXF85893.1 DUF2339 domain-containing protein [Alkalicoccus halolimnae]
MDNETRIEILEKKVKYLEEKIEVLTDKKKEETIYTEKTAVIQSRKQLQKKAVQQDPPKEKKNWEETFGKIWLPRIFIIIMLLGVMWAFVAAIDYGYVTEPVRLAIGVIVSLLLYYGGAKQIAGHRENLGQVLLGGAVVVAMFTVFAGNSLYGVIPSTFAFVFHVIIIGTACAWTIKHRSEALGIITSIGGVLVPFLIDSANPNFFVFLTYEFVLVTALLALAFLYKYKIMFIIAFGLYHLAMIIFTGAATLTDYWETIALSLLVLNHLVLLGLFAFSKKVITEKSFLIVLHISFIFTAFWVHTFLYEAAVGWFLIISVLFYGFLAYYLFNKENYKNYFTVSLSIAGFALAYYVLLTFDMRHIGVLLLLQGTTSLWLSVRLKNLWNIIFSSAVYFTGGVIVLTTSINTIFSQETLGWLVLVITLGYMIHVIKIPKNSRSNVITWKFILKWLHLFVVLTFLSQVISVLTVDISNDVTAMSISVVWVLYALGNVAFGVMQADKTYRLIGIVLLMATLLKIIFLDLPDMDLLIRAILFLIVGGMGILASRFWYTK